MDKPRAETEHDLTSGYMTEYQDPFSDDFEAVVEVVSDQRSRSVCCYFHWYSAETATLDDLVQFVLAQSEHDSDGRQVATLLHHVTLPKLDDGGFLEYDARTHTTRYGDHEHLEHWLDRILDVDRLPTTAHLRGSKTGSG